MIAARGLPLYRRLPLAQRVSDLRKFSCSYAIQQDSQLHGSTVLYLG